MPCENFLSEELPINGSFFETINNDEVHVWTVNVVSHLLDLKKNRLLLSQTEIEKAKKYRFVEHENSYITRRAILRYILSLYLEVPPKEIEIELGQYGKPYLKKTRRNLHFNMSHSKGLVYYVVTKIGSVGIDIEFIDKEKDVDNLAQLVLHEKELKLYEQMPEEKRIRLFYDYWSQKEAIVKAIGVGLSQPLKSIQMIEPIKSSNFQVVDPKGSSSCWNVKTLKTHFNYSGSIALDKNITDIRYFTI